MEIIPTSKVSLSYLNKVRAAIAIVYIFIDHKQVILFSIAAQHHALIFDGYRFACPLIVAADRAALGGVVDFL